MLKPRQGSIETKGVVDYTRCPAKTFETASGTTLGRSVFNHCQIVGEVARELVRRQPFSCRSFDLI